MCKAKDLVEKLDNIMTDIESEYSRFKTEVSQADLEQQDILHLIENDEKFNASEGYKYAKMIQDIRKKRRNVKNEFEVIQCLYAYSSALKAKVGEVKKRVDKKYSATMKHTTFTPRVLTKSNLILKAETKAKTDIQKLRSVNKTNIVFKNRPELDRLNELFEQIKNN